MNQVLVIGNELGVLGEREARAGDEAAHGAAALIGVHRVAIGGLGARGLLGGGVVVGVAIRAAAAVVFELGGVGVERVLRAGGGRDEGFIVPAGAGGGAGVQCVIEVQRVDAVVAECAADATVGDGGMSGGLLSKKLNTMFFRYLEPYPK